MDEAPRIAGQYQRLVEAALEKDDGTDPARVVEPARVTEPVPRPSEDPLALRLVPPGIAIDLGWQRAGAADVGIDLDPEFAQRLSYFVSLFFIAAIFWARPAAYFSYISLSSWKVANM